MGDGLALLPCSPEMLRAISGIPTDLPEPTPPTPQCCPAYTRESMNKAQDDKLSSVQAQFIACHELIASQLGKHWVATDRICEDRGYSGSHIRRPVRMGCYRILSTGWWTLWWCIARTGSLDTWEISTRKSSHKGGPRAALMGGGSHSSVRNGNSGANSHFDRPKIYRVS